MSAYEAQLQAAYQALKDGHKREARTQLQEVLRENPKEWRAWLWLAGVAPSPRASLEYVRRAEQLNPDNPTIQRARHWAERQVTQAEAAGATAGKLAPPVSQQPATPLPTPAVQAEKQSSRRLPLIAGLVVVMLLLFLVSGFIWNRSSARSPAADQAKETQPAVAQAPTLQSGYFVPRNPASLDEPTPVLPTVTALAFSPKAIVAEKGAPRPTWTATPTPTNTPTPAPTPVPTFISNVTDPQPVSRPDGVGPTERWIDVNLTQQKLVAYEGSIPVYESLVSSGTSSHPTVTGQFRVWLRLESQTMDGRRLGYDYYLPNVPHVMYFYQDYALHGTYWHNNFGNPMSHGCVNLPNTAAEWLFNWSSMGTVVNVHY